MAKSLAAESPQRGLTHTWSGVPGVRGRSGRNRNQAVKTAPLSPHSTSHALVPWAPGTTLVMEHSNRCVGEISSTEDQVQRSNPSN